MLPISAKSEAGILSRTQLPACRPSYRNEDGLVSRPRLSRYVPPANVATSSSRLIFPLHVQPGCTLLPLMYIWLNVVAPRLDQCHAFYGTPSLADVILKHLTSPRLTGIRKTVLTTAHHAYIA